MSYYHRSAVALSALAAQILIVVPAMAQSTPAPTPAQLIEALKSKSARSVKAPQSSAEVAADAQAAKLIQALKDKASRGLSASTQERVQLASIVEPKSQLDLDVPFEFNSTEISAAAVAPLNSLGKALQDGQMSKADFLLAGHTDAKGRAPYNQRLSQLRAEAVRAYLVKNFSIPNEKLIPVGYGREKLKNPKLPFADENRRVQVVNLGK
ncbi:MAG: OmpA family protein [Hyphomicrobiaceae bacterium]